MSLWKSGKVLAILKLARGCVTKLGTIVLMDNVPPPLKGWFINTRKISSGTKIYKNMSIKFNPVVIPTINSTSQPIFVASWKTPSSTHQHLGSRQPVLPLTREAVPSVSDGPRSSVSRGTSVSRTRCGPRVLSRGCFFQVFLEWDTTLMLQKSGDHQLRERWLAGILPLTVNDE